MKPERDDDRTWTRETVLELGVAPAIRGTLVDDREPDPGTLQKKDSGGSRRDSRRDSRREPRRDGSRERNRRRERNRNR